MLETLPQGAQERPPARCVALFDTSCVSILAMLGKGLQALQKGQKLLPIALPTLSQVRQTVYRQTQTQARRPSAQPHAQHGRHANLQLMGADDSALHEPESDRLR